VFGRQGFADASIQGIAAEAKVVPNAVYYHFSGKEELFDVALRVVIDSVNAVVAAARPVDGEPGDPNALGRVIDAVWDWMEANPEQARLLHSHLPGATRQARALHQDFLDLHVQQAFDYLGSARVPESRRAAMIQYARHALTVRTLITLTTNVSALHLEDGPLAGHARRSLRPALREVGTRIIRVR
jgi:AcrR family transcriptional regulator